MVNMLSKQEITTNNTYDTKKDKNIEVSKAFIAISLFSNSIPYGCHVTYDGLRKEQNRIEEIIQSKSIEYQYE